MLKIKMLLTQSKKSRTLERGMVVVVVVVVVVVI